MGPEAEAEAEVRLGWVDTFRRSRDLLPGAGRAAGRAAPTSTTSCWPAWAAPHSRPRSSPARSGVGLTVLDTTDPHQVRAALADRLDRTVVVVSSKSGSTVETDSHRRAYWQAFADAGVSRHRPPVRHRHRPRLAAGDDRPRHGRARASWPTPTSAAGTAR